MTSLEERARLSAALNDIDVQIHSNLSSDQILQAALDGFVATLHADAGDIKMYEDGEWSVSYESGFGSEAVGLRLAVSEAPVASRVMETNAPVTIRDYLAEPPEFFVGFPKMFNLRSTLAIPLVARGEVVGSLFAWMRNDSREFSAGEVDFGRRMAASLSLAFENARLHEAEKNARALLEQELERTRVLLKASSELAATTDVGELLERLSRVVLEATGISRVFINQIDMRQQVLIPRIAVGGLVAPRGKAIPLTDLSETSQRAIAGKQTVLLDYELADTPEKDVAISNANGAKLVLFIPLLGEEGIIGHISLDQPDERYEFTAEQIRTVEGISRQASVALRNASRYERERRIADTLQHAILQPPEPVECLEVAYLYQPASAAANVGGDFYDVLDLSDDRVGILIGDVAGKGIEAAQLTTLIRDGARAYLLESADPSDVLRRLNALVYRFTPVEAFASAFFGILDGKTGELRYCGAGHPAPIIMGPDRHALLESKCGLLGAFPETMFVTDVATLSPGEVLTMTTDGVTEARNEDGDLFGDEGVMEAVTSLRDTPVAELPEALLDRVLNYAGGDLRDDIVILCVSRTEPSAGE